MCGFSGMINFGFSEFNSENLRRMVTALAHRGPDGENITWFEGVGLGHRRLAIVGLSGGIQPLEDKETGVRLVFNGEIYNYIELARDMGFSRLGLSDSDVLLKAYLKWGLGMLNRLNGMFAFAIHDPRTNCIHLARDRLGIKPLFYYVSGKQLVFASELNALMLSSIIPEDLDENAMLSFLRLGYVPTPNTIYRNVYKLPPASCMTFQLDDGRIKSDRYWQINPSVREISEERAIEELSEILDNVISQHLRADVNFGAFLSGGIDSTLVTYKMSQLLNCQVKTFMVCFNDDENSDFFYAQEAAKIIGTEHECDKVSAEISPDLLMTLAGSFGEPFADSSFIPTFLVSRLSSSRVKMVLSGDGGDELFGGYESYKSVFERQKAKWRAPLLKKIAANFLTGEHSRILRRESAPWEKLHHMERSYIEAHDASKIIPKGQIIKSNDDSLEEPLHGDPILRCQYHDVKHYLLDDILNKVDHMSMLNGLEVRVPLLDHRIVEFAFNLPLSLRVQETEYGLQTKILLKKLLRPKFSSQFVSRRKIGFGIPLSTSLHGSLKTLVQDLLLGDHGAMTGFVDSDIVRSIVKKYYSGNPQLWASLWAVFCMRLWFETKQVSRSG